MITTEFEKQYIENKRRIRQIYANIKKNKMLPIVPEVLMTQEIKYWEECLLEGRMMGYELDVENYLL